MSRRRHTGGGGGGGGGGNRVRRKMKIVYSNTKFKVVELAVPFRSSVFILHLPETPWREDDKEEMVVV